MLFIAVNHIETLECCFGQNSLELKSRIPHGISQRHGLVIFNLGFPSRLRILNPQVHELPELIFRMLSMCAYFYKEGQ